LEFSFQYSNATDLSKRTGGKREIFETIEGFFSICKPYSSNTSENRRIKLLFEGKERCICWKAHSETILSVVFDPKTENKTACLNFVQQFPLIVENHFKRPSIMQSWRELMSKPEEVLMLLNSLIQNGTIIFANSSYSKFLRREIVSLLLN